MYLNLKEL